MNPTLPADYLERMEADDPEAYRSEVLGEFHSAKPRLASKICMKPRRSWKSGARSFLLGA